jgi:TRAP-type mannitol/chloroaromatic compound transport system substrate-binding protein
MARTRQLQNKTSAAGPSRRRFLGNAAALGGAAAVATLAACGADKDATQTAAAGGSAGSELPQLNLRFQAGVPAKDFFYEMCRDHVRIISEVSGERMKIDLLPSGAVVGAFDIADAVHKGTLDGGYAVPAFWYGKNSALSLFGTGPAFGQNSFMLLAWYQYGGGRALYEELYRDVLKLDVVPMLYGPMGVQPLGWFKREVKSAEDFKGLKYRTVGLSIDLYTEMGASVVALPGGDVVPGLDRGLIDAAEFNNPSSDNALGFPDVSKVCMTQSYHQPGECLEILVNRRVWDALPEIYRTLFRIGTQAATTEFAWKVLERHSADYAEMRDRRAVRFVKTPDEVLKAQLKAWEKVIARKSAENPFFAKVVASQRAWFKRVVDYQLKFEVSPRLAYEHFFGAAG